jgi:hypothetical protein
LGKAVGKTGRFGKASSDRPPRKAKPLLDADGHPVQGKGDKSAVMNVWRQAAARVRSVAAKSYTPSCEER